jgi:hypothetical protein
VAHGSRSEALAACQEALETCSARVILIALQSKNRSNAANRCRLKKIPPLRDPFLE